MAGKGNKEKRPQLNKKITSSSTNVPPSRKMFRAPSAAIGSCSRQATHEAAKSTTRQPWPTTLSTNSSRQPHPNRPAVPVTESPPLILGMEDDVSVDGPPTKKRVRGLTTNKMVAKLNPGQQIDMELGSELRAIGPNSAKFANFLGPLVRCAKFVPVQVDNWSAVDEGVKEWLFTRACDYFNFDDSINLEHVRWAVYQTAGNAFRNNRYDLKGKYYDIHATDEERLAADPPPGMTKEDWEFLVRKFGSSKFKRISSRNSSNRHLATVKHTSGSVNHARVREIETEKNGGVPPSEYELFTKVHTHKSDGTPADEETARIITQVEEITISQGEDSTSSVNIDEIFNRVRGQNRKRNFRPRIDRSAELARLKDLEERLANETAKREEAERRVEESRLEDIRRHEEMDRKLAELERDRVGRETMERRIIELTSHRASHEESERRRLELEMKLADLERANQSREALMEKKLTECLEKINRYDSFRETFESQGMGMSIHPWSGLKGKGKVDDDSETCADDETDDENVND